MKKIVFTEKAIGFATFIGGPLSGTFLIGLNFSAQNKSRHFWGTIILGFAYTLLLLGVSMSLPDQLGNSFGIVINAVNSGLLYYLVTKLQKKEIDELIATEQARTSKWATTGYTIGGLLVTLAILFGVAFSSPPDGYSDSVSFKNGNCKIHITQDIDKEEVERIGEYFDKSPLMADFSAGELVMKSDGARNSLRFIYNPPIEKMTEDSVFNLFLLTLEQEINLVIKPKKRIEISITDPELINTVAIAYQYRQYLDNCRDYLAYPVTFNHRILFGKNISIDVVRTMAGQLQMANGVIPKNSPLDFVLERYDGGYYVTLSCDKGAYSNLDFTNALTQVKLNLCRSYTVNSLVFTIKTEGNGYPQERNL